MWKKTFIRFTLILLVALATMLVFASTRNTTQKASSDGTESGSSDCSNKCQADVEIWESLTQAFMGVGQE